MSLRGQTLLAVQRCDSVCARATFSHETADWQENVDCTYVFSCVFMVYAVYRVFLDTEDAYNSSTCWNRH